MTLHSVVSRAKYVLAKKLPPKLYWHLMGTFKAVPAVTSECRSAAESQATGKDVVHLLAKLDVFDSDSVVLQIGSGLGRIEQHLAPRVRRCFGLDISPAMVRKAQGLVKHPNVEFVCTDGRDLSGWPDESLDLVYSFLVFQHLPRPQARAYVESAFDKLRPGRFLVFQMMIRDHREHPEPPSSHPYGLRHYMRGGVVDLLQDVGFEDVASYEMDGSPDTGKPEGDVVFVARRPPAGEGTQPRR